MYRFFLSIRFVLRHWLMTLIGSFFVGASLVVLIVVMAVMDGFQAKLKDTYAGSQADLIVTPRFNADLDALERTLREDLGDRLVATGPYYQTITMARRQARIDPALQDPFQVVQVFGVDGRKEQRVNRFGEYLYGGSQRKRLSVIDLDRPFKVHDPLDEAAGFRGVILGKRLRISLGVVLGQKIRIFALVPKNEESVDNGGTTKVKDFDLREELFVVVGEYQSANSEIDGICVFMDHAEFRDFFGAETSRRAVRAKLADPADFDTTKKILRGRWQDIVRRSIAKGQTKPDWMMTPEHAMEIHPWWKQYETLMRAIESEKAMILTISFLIVIAGTSSIFAAQWLLVSDKTREIGILRALGADVGGIASIFVMNGFLMGLIGASAGTGIGLLAVEHIDRIHEFVTWLTGRDVFPAEIYLFTGIPTQTDPRQVAQYALAALVCTLIAAAIPAIRAGLMDPAQALHNE